MDFDGKATELRPFSLAATLTCSPSTFYGSPSLPASSPPSPLPLLPLIHDSVSLTDSHLSLSAVVLARLLIGPSYDLLGPRVPLDPPFVFDLSAVGSPEAFIVIRFFNGFSLAGFMSNQHWMSSLLLSNVVEFANGVSHAGPHPGFQFRQFSSDFYA
ncbi:High affinity nitrate transporter 2.7 [Acorus calamus]|uniref:High affinity nitrate transporter 2.7 n=1 Tax=Acorus calamus TaxID=4465 RepID=A0AAV9CA52_ACOCL|nr:High affinity nitrate transporter 2.7 [Acorus calamus]